MRVEFSRDVLMEALNSIGKFASICKDKKEYCNLKLQSCKDKALLEIGSDKGFLHLGVECNIIEEGVACFDVFDFISIVTKLDGNIILLNTLNNDSAVVISNYTSKIKLRLINSELFVASMSFANKFCGSFVISSKELVEAANLCLPFEDEPQLIPGINIRLTPDKKLQLCCCSNIAMGIYIATPISIKPCDELDFTLPTQSFKSLCDIVKGGNVAIEFFGAIARIALPNGFVAFRMLGKTYPKVEKLIPSSFENTIPLHTSTLSNALSLIDIIAFDGSVLLEYTPNKCTISNKAGFHTTIDTNVDMSVTIKIERRLLRRLLRLFPTQIIIELLYSGYLRPVVVKDKNKLIMLSVLEQK